MEVNVLFRQQIRNPLGGIVPILTVKEIEPQSFGTKLTFGTTVLRIKQLQRAMLRYTGMKRADNGKAETITIDYAASSDSVKTAE